MPSCLRLRTSTLRVVTLVLLVGSGAPVQGQDTRVAPGAFDSAREADPDDVGSVDAIITALYDVISGPVGEVRDQGRFRSLFTPDARLIPTNAQAPGGYVALTPDEYWARSADQLARIGFTEAEIGRTTETFGMVTHAFSTYESYRGDQGDPDTPFARGINSIQILESGGRFWIMSVMWDSERPGNAIPDRYIGPR